MIRAVYLKPKCSTDTHNDFLRSWGWLLCDNLSQKDSSDRNASFEEALGTTEGAVLGSSIETSSTSISSKAILFN